MQPRRIVTGVDDAGKSVVLSDGASPRERAYRHVPGFGCTLLWAEGGTPTAARRTDPAAEATTLLAAPGGAVFLSLTFPPDSVYGAADFDAAAAGAEHLANVPGIAERFEADSPGMHRTPTLDFVTLVSGIVVLELDDGATTTLQPGDTVIQQGTRHAWRNPGPAPAVLSVVMIGTA